MAAAAVSYDGHVLIASNDQPQIAALQQRAHPHRREVAHICLAILPSAWANVVRAAFCARDFAAVSRSDERCGLKVHERAATHAHGRKRPAQKKWPLRRAAKFREETPRKGGGLAIEGSRYRAAAICRNCRFVCKPQSITIPDKTPQKSWKNLSQLPGFSASLLPPSAIVQRNIAGNPVNRGRFITPSHPRNKRFARSSYLPAMSQGWRYSDGRNCVVRQCCWAASPQPAPRHRRSPALDMARFTPASHHLHLRHPSGHARLQGRGAGRLPGAQ